MGMIRILMHGTKVKVYETICNDCGCKFEYLESDAEDKRETGKLYLTCPDCGRTFRMPEHRASIADTSGGVN